MMLFAFSGKLSFALFSCTGIGSHFKGSLTTPAFLTTVSADLTTGMEKLKEKENPVNLYITNKKQTGGGRRTT